MKKNFWLQCWQKNHIAFHQLSFHPWLDAIIKGLLPEYPIKTFIPLCGKSDDILWFANQGQAIGSELSEIACHDFFAEKEINSKKLSASEHTVYQHQNISIWQGDFFQLTPVSIGTVDFVYDRAALVALPKEMQADYVRHLKRFIDIKTQLLVVAIEFNNDNWQGPPFPVNQVEIETLFSEFCVQKIAEQELSDKKFAQRQMSVGYLKETLYLIKRKTE